LASIYEQSFTIRRFVVRTNKIKDWLTKKLIYRFNKAISPFIKFILFMQLSVEI
jgi:hypothetical protein